MFDCTSILTTASATNDRKLHTMCQGHVCVRVCVCEHAIIFSMRSAAHSYILCSTSLPQLTRAQKEDQPMIAPTTRTHIVHGDVTTLHFIYYYAIIPFGKLLQLTLYMLWIKDAVFCLFFTEYQTLICWLVHFLLWHPNLASNVQFIQTHLLFPAQNVPDSHIPASHQGLKRRSREATLTVFSSVPFYLLQTTFVFFYTSESMKTSLY